MTVFCAMDSSVSKNNMIDSTIASGWVSGSFAGSNMNLSNNKKQNMNFPNQFEEKGTNLVYGDNPPFVASSIFRRSTDVAKTALVTGNYTMRTNPFNRDMRASDEEEDSMSRSNGSEFTSTTSESGDVSLAELGLTEDYFGHPEGLFGMSSAEELEAAIDNCKRMILDLPESSDRRKKYVKKLVELRMKLQELKEGPEEIEPKIKQVLGHKLRKRNSSSMKYYCDCCNNLILGMLQVWYRCRECGFSCHSKCVNAIRRDCVAVNIGSVTYSLSISPEVGLSAQQFHCAECKNLIGIGGVGKEEARLCDYTGQYFCPNCHWNDTMVIPARVMHNWDFSSQKVSRRSYQLLHRLSRRPLLNVQEINPMLFNYVEELADIRKLREDILLMKAYFTTCNRALEMKILLKLERQQHFVDNSSMYSMVDLVKAQDGTLTEHLTDVHASFAKHIKLDCMYCQAKGFICEICNSGETLFPFDFGVATCGKCKAVFHRDCFTCIDTLCPRCERLQKKKLQKTAPDLPSEESDAESNYLHDQAMESPATNQKHGDASCSSITDVEDDKTSTQVEYVEKSLTEPMSVEQKPKKHQLNSLHMLLTDSSYTDYALLGFAGSGRGRKFPAKSSGPSKNRSQPQVHENGGSLGENAPTDSYASYRTGQKLAKNNDRKKTSETSSGSNATDSGGSKSSSDNDIKVSRVGKRRGSERRSSGSRGNLKGSSVASKTPLRSHTPEDRRSSLASFIEHSGMTEDVMLRTASSSESAGFRGKEKRRNSTRKINRSEKDLDKFNPFAMVVQAELSPNSDSGYDGNPFQTEDDISNPFLTCDNDPYDEEKNPFSQRFRK